MSRSSRPNILVIFSDQHRAQAMSCAGDPNIQTTHLDRLAAEGVRFAHAYANTPLCAPCRATLYTGQHITTHGVISLHRPLLPRQPVLAEVLREHGYHTSHMGKWHLSGGAGPSHFASPYFRPGWDDWRGWENSNEPLATEYSDGDLPFPLKTMDGYQTDVLTDWTLDWLAARDGTKPWFHVMSIEPPHPPNVAPPEYHECFDVKDLQLRDNVPLDSPKLETYRTHLRAYYAQIANLDHNIGRVLDKLDALGIREDTMVVYLSDHGDFMGSHDRMQKSRPEEESSAIPLIMSWPGVTPPGGVCESLISVMDLMPTLLGAVDVPVPASVQGQDLSRCLRDPAAAGADEVILSYESTFWPETPAAAYRGIRHGVWKYIQWREPGRDLLYRLDTDPYELDNLAEHADHRATRDHLAATLRTRLAALHDPFPERPGV